jgi:hypothetical protein
MTIPKMQFYTNLNRDSKSLINSFTNDVTTLGKNSINLDYVNPLTETTKLELGLEARDESTANNLFRDNTVLTLHMIEQSIGLRNPW